MTKPETIQDYFNIAWDHAVVRRQPPGAVFDDFGLKMCLYRTPDGCRCLIGAGIADEDYTPTLESKPASMVLAAIGYTVPPERAKYEDLLINLLQQCHDRTMRGASSEAEAAQTYRDKIEGQLREFATTYGLQVPGATTA